MGLANTISQALAFMSPTEITSGYQWVRDLIHMIFADCPKVLAEVTVDLTAAATTPIFTVPAGYNLEVDDFNLIGHTAQSGGTSTVLKLTDGTNHWLNGSSGHTFVSATATTLLPADKRVRASDLYAPSAMNGGLEYTLPAATVINAVTSGTVVTAGKVKVQLVGRLVRA